MANDEQQIRDLVATWIEATKAGDVDAVLSLMTDDVVFLVAGRPPMIGKAAFAAAMQAMSANGPMQFEGHSEVQEVEVHGDVAFMWTKLAVTMTPPGAAASIMRAGNTLSVLKKQQGKWLLARDANLLVTVDPAKSPSPSS